MDSAGQPGRTRSDRSLIPDLRDITLSDLARKAGASEQDVTGLVQRILNGQESPSGVKAMMFNSSI